MLSFILLKLTLQDVLADIPHDAAALLIYALLVLFIGFTWAGSRGRPKADRSARGEHGR